MPSLLKRRCSISEYRERPTAGGVYQFHVDTTPLRETVTEKVTKKVAALPLHTRVVETPDYQQTKIDD